MKKKYNILKGFLIAVSVALFMVSGACIYFWIMFESKMFITNMLETVQIDIDKGTNVYSLYCPKSFASNTSHNQKINLKFAENISQVQILFTSEEAGKTIFLEASMEGFVCEDNQYIYQGEIISGGELMIDAKIITPKILPKEDELAIINIIIFAE